MSKGIGPAIGIIFLIIGFIFFPNIMRTTEAIRVRDVTEEHLATTVGGEYTTDIVIYNDLYDANLSYIVDVNSSDASDNPVATVYNVVSRVLTVEGLAESSSRTLQVEYQTDALEGTTGVKPFNDIMPFLFMGMFIAIGGAILVNAYRNR